MCVCVCVGGWGEVKKPLFSAPLKLAPGAHVPFCPPQVIPHGVSVSRVIYSIQLCSVKYSKHFNIMIRSAMSLSLFLSPYRHGSCRQCHSHQRKGLILPLHPNCTPQVHHFAEDGTRRPQKVSQDKGQWISYNGTTLCARRM